MYMPGCCYYLLPPRFICVWGMCVCVPVYLIHYSIKRRYRCGRFWCQGCWLLLGIVVQGRLYRTQIKAPINNCAWSRVRTTRASASPLDWHAPVITMMRRTHAHLNEMYIVYSIHLEILYVYVVNLWTRLEVGNERTNGSNWLQLMDEPTGSSVRFPFTVLLSSLILCGIYPSIYLGYNRSITRPLCDGTNIKHLIDIILAAYLSFAVYICVCESWSMRVCVWAIDRLNGEREWRTGSVAQTYRTNWIVQIWTTFPPLLSGDIFSAVHDQSVHNLPSALCASSAA